MAFYYYDHLKHRAGEGVQEGGGLIFLGDIGMFLFGGLFFMVCGCLAAAYRNEARFYLWLGLIALVQPIAFLQIADIHST